MGMIRIMEQVNTRFHMGGAPEEVVAVRIFTPRARGKRSSLFR